MKKIKFLLALFILFFCVFPGIGQSIWGGSVSNFIQGSTNYNNQVAEERSNPELSLGLTNNLDEINFVSLGFGGEITIEMSQPIRNGEGNDLKVWETTFAPTNCTIYPEKASVFASQDGCHFVSLGVACQDEEFDLGLLNWARYIKIVDQSSTNAFRRFGEVDAFDVDAVEGFYFEFDLAPSSLQAGYATSVVEYSPGLRKNGTPITPARTNPQMALGIPQGTDVINFVSLGFGGSLILGFDYAVFSQQGFDLQLIETTFGNPPCQNYPEKVLIEVSKDLITWEFADALCLDGFIDVQFSDWFQYIRFTDRSAASQFSGSADGYDVDGIVVLEDCITPQSRRENFDDILTPDEEVDDLLYPNPFDNIINISTPEEVEVTIMDYTGRRLKTFKTTGKFEVDLKPGNYYFELRQKTGEISIHKLMKR